MCKNIKVSTVLVMLHLVACFMPYYGLFSRDLHIRDLQWRSLLCSLLACSMTHYDITMGHDIVRDAPIVTQQWVMMLLGTSIVMSQKVMALLCVHNMASQ